MTNDERVRNLQTFGYTERESHFLVQAALHSGYFLRRQYCAAIGRKLGKTPDKFILRLRNERHAAEIDLRYHRKVYNLCSKVLFEALGEPDNRNRRRHDTQTIKARLMGFDYVLARPEFQYYPTESEKLRLFSGERGIEKEHLPTWRYSSKDGKQTTFRWFVDKPLIFTTETPRTVHFGFVDPGYRTADAFTSFLRNYRPLFARLERFEVVYIAGFEKAAEVAKGLFDRLVSPTGAAPQDPLAADVIAYFADRKEHAISGLSSFDQQRLDTYRESRKRFGGARFDEMFELWSRQGDAAIQVKINPESRSDMRGRGTFKAHVSVFDFGLFGSLYEAGRGD